MPEATDTNNSSTVSVEGKPQKETKKRSSKTVIFVVIGVLLACVIACCALFGLLGYFPSGDECLYKGPLSTVNEGPCAEGEDDEDTDENNEDENEESTESGDSEESEEEADNTEAEEKKAEEDDEDDEDSNASDEVSTFFNNDYSFQYPESWIVDDTGSLVYVYPRDPESIPAGELNDNINVAKQGNFSGMEVEDMSNADCREVAEQVMLGLGEVFDESELVSAKMETVNDQASCVVHYSHSLFGKPVDQYQYYFSGQGQFFVITLTLERFSTNTTSAQMIPYTFEIRN